MVFSFSTLGLSLYEKDRGRQEKEKKKNKKRFLFFQLLAFLCMRKTEEGKKKEKSEKKASTISKIFYNITFVFMQISCLIEN